MSSFFRILIYSQFRIALGVHGKKFDASPPCCLFIFVPMCDGRKRLLNHDSLIQLMINNNGVDKDVVHRHPEGASYSSSGYLIPTFTGVLLPHDLTPPPGVSHVREENQKTCSMQTLAMRMGLSADPRTLSTLDPEPIRAGLCKYRCSTSMCLYSTHPRTIGGEFPGS